MTKHIIASAVMKHCLVLQAEKNLLGEEDPYARVCGA